MQSRYRAARQCSSVRSAIAFLLAAWRPAAGADAVIEGKDNWLFAGWESLTVDRPAAERSSIQLIADVNRSLAQQNIKLIVALVPIKPRYYKALLPEGLSIAEAVEKRYDFLLVELRSAGIAAPDLRDALKKVITGKQEYRPIFTGRHSQRRPPPIKSQMSSSVGPLPGSGSGAHRATDQ